MKLTRDVKESFAGIHGTVFYMSFDKLHPNETIIQHGRNPKIKIDHAHRLENALGSISYEYRAKMLIDYEAGNFYPSAHLKKGVEYTIVEK